MDPGAEDLAVRTGAGVYRPTLGFIEADGPEAASYLQNLATADMRSLQPGHGCETFFTTHKARTVAHATFLCKSPESFLLAVEDDRGESLFTHLDRHLISERVELKRSDLAAIRLVGPRAAAACGGESLSPWCFKTRADGVIVRRQTATSDGYDLIADAATIDREYSRLTPAIGVPISAEVVEALRIESGWPAWGKEMDENRFVVELGRPEAISYAKGCYLGQEPIVMARDRGHVNRRLMKFTASSPLEAGARTMQGEVELFRATSVAYSHARQETIGLAFVRGQPSAGETLTVPTAGGDVKVRLVDSFDRNQ